jgi:hypothetical protein
MKNIFFHYKGLNCLKNVTRLINIITGNENSANKLWGLKDRKTLKKEGKLDGRPNKYQIFSNNSQK